MSESGHDTKVSWLTGKALSHKANIIASKSYNTQSDYRFDMKTFMELRNAQSVVTSFSLAVGYVSSLALLAFM